MSQDLHITHQTLGRSYTPHLIRAHTHSLMTRHMRVAFIVLPHWDAMLLALWCGMPFGHIVLSLFKVLISIAITNFLVSRPATSSASPNGNQLPRCDKYQFYLSLQIKLKQSRLYQSTYCRYFRKWPLKPSNYAHFSVAKSVENMVS